METTLVTDESLAKLRKEIINEGINKKNYSSDEEDVDQDSDDDLIMKFVKPKGKTNQFETTAYAFALNNKMSKLRSELARSEERMRYLQLDYNNKEIQIDEQKITLNKLKETLKVITFENKTLNLKVNQFKYSTIVSLTLFGITFINNFLN